MKIYYDSIENDQFSVLRSFSFKEDNELINIENFTGAIFKTDGMYFLRGEMNFELHCLCDRCAEAAVIKLKHNVEVGVEPGGRSGAGVEQEYEMTDDDGDIYVTDPEYADLDEILRQEALLQLPVKRLCRPDCRGENIEEHGICDDEANETPLKGLSSLKRKLKEK